MRRASLSDAAAAPEHRVAGGQLSAGAMRWRAAGIALILLSTGALSPARADVFRQFKDWAVSCSDGLSCTATVDGSTGPIYGLSLTREKAPDAPLTLRLNTDVQDTPTGPVGFAFEDGATIEIAAERFSLDENGALTTQAPVLGERLIDAMREAKNVTVSVPRSAQTARQTFSLSGLTASLLFVDEIQRRDGTVTALVARGDAPAADISALPDDVAAPDALPEAVRKAWTESPSGCSDFGSFMPEPLGFSAKVPEARLFGLACGSPGAYNFYYEFFLQTEDGVLSVPFPEIGDEGPIVARGAWNSAWDDASKTLSAFFKGRGLGDCGGFQRWRWSEAGGSYGGFVLEESRAKTDCDGDYAGGPMEWPRLWPPQERS